MGVSYENEYLTITLLEDMAREYEKFVYADGLDIYELAEYFDVTPEFMKRAIEYYHQRGERW